MGIILEINHNWRNFYCYRIIMIFVYGVHVYFCLCCSLIHFYKLLSWMLDFSGLVLSQRTIWSESNRNICFGNWIFKLKRELLSRKQISITVYSSYNIWYDCLSLLFWTLKNCWYLISDECCTYWVSQWIKSFGNSNHSAELLQLIKHFTWSGLRDE